MNKDFKFVDGTKTDKSTRRVALSHAMKGKNIGKTHQRRSRLDQCQPQKYYTKPPVRWNCRDKKNSDITTAALLAYSEQPLVCQSLPVPLLLETTPRSLEVIRNYFTFVVEAVYPSVLCLSLDRLKSYWIQMMYIDRTSYHCSLALMATLNGFVFAREAESLEAVHHLGKAVGLINQKLDTVEALSNSSISVVNFLIIREMFRDEQYSAEIHLKGLQKMVRLRGGLSRLEDDRTLVLKISKTDIDYAFRYGTPTGFYRDYIAQAAKEMALNEFIIIADYSVSSRTNFDEIDPFLLRILLDIIGLAHWFNRGDKTHKADPDMLQEVIVSVCYRLVRFHVLGSPPLESKLDAAYHIGLIAFMTTLFLQIDGRRFLRYTLVSRCLRNVLERRLGDDDSDSLLWLLFIGGISILEEADQRWAVQQISHMVKFMGIESWVQLHQLLIQFPWIGAIHDEPGKALWETVMTSSIEDS